MNKKIKTAFASVAIFFLAQAKAVAVHAPPRALDINPNPKIVEIELTAQEAVTEFVEGVPTTAYTYNGVTPGPTIEANVGDTLIVNFRNELSEPTTIHWHGLELPANMDGSSISQLQVPPSGYFRYEFKLLRAATFWYHPHINTKDQIERGLYGALVVRDPAEKRLLGLPRFRETLLILDDVLLDENYQIAPFETDDPIETAEIQLNGREGNHFLVNGRTGVWKRRGLTGSLPLRVRVINVANSRFMRLSFENANVWRIGGDGGLLEKPIPIEPIGLVPNPEYPGEMISDPDPGKGVLLTPAERADLYVDPHCRRGRCKPVRIVWHDIMRGRHAVFSMNDGNGFGLGDAEDDGKRPPQHLGSLTFLGGHDRRDNAPPDKLRTIEPIDTSSAAMKMLMFGHTPPDAMTGDVVFFAQMKNGMPLPMNQVTPKDAPSVRVGDTVIWAVRNMTGGIHNFHHHGFHGQLLETEFVDMDNPENNYKVPAGYIEDKDTFPLPARPGAIGRSYTITKIAMRFDDTGRKGQILAAGKVPTETESGGWLAHCHILEHADLGMMTFTQVVKPLTD